MIGELLRHPKALGISLGLHLVVVALIAFEFAFTDKPELVNSETVEETVQAEVVDASVLEQREAAKAAEAKRQQDALRQEELKKQQQADAKRKAEEERKAEAKRQADDRRKAEEKRKADEKLRADAKREADAKARAAAAAKSAEDKRKAEAERAADEQRKAEQARVAEEKRRADEARRAEEERKRLEVEARRRAEAEQKRKEEELRTRLEAEENQRRLNTLRDAYILAIRQKVERNWRRPAGSGKMPVCEVHVQQGPGGIILDVTFGACSGSTATYRRSIENAVYKAEPLPKPGDEAIFERNLTFLFNPGE